MKMIFAAAVILFAGAAFAADAPDAGATYKAKCASCHGKDGKGNDKMLKMLKVEAKELNLVDEGTLADKDEDLLKAIVEGKNKKMPAFKGKLGGLDAAELVKYLRALKPEPAPKGK